MACFDFDGGNADNRSSHDLKIHTNDVQYVTGKVSLAMQFAIDSDADVDDDPVFDVSSVSGLTIEAWIQPAQMVANTTILDVNKQYAIQVHRDGMVNCALSNTNTQLTADARIQVNAWTHIACTYDNATHLATLYANGSQIASDTGDNTLAIDGTTGMSLGADNPPLDPDTRVRFIGLLDQVRLMNRVRTAAELCADAGQAVCQ